MRLTKSTTLRTEIENLKCQARKQTNLQQENIDELIDCHIRRDRDKCSLIYANRENIKKNEACHHVWINECLDAEQRKARAETRAIVDLAKTLGKEAKAVADVAITSGIKYSHKSFPTLPPQITLEKAFTRQLNGKLYFNSEHSPFLSFHTSPITYGNEKYANNKQAFQHQRAVNAGSLDVAAEIKQTTDPRRCKFLSRMIPASPNWDNKKDEVMGDLVQIKVQDPSIKLKLQQTGDLDLVECTSDSYWACGASFRSKKVQTNTTTGANKLGKQCLKLRFYFLHSAGAKISQLCTQQHSPVPLCIQTSWFSKENVRTSGAHCRKVCARQWKCAPRAPGAPLISNTGKIWMDTRRNIKLTNKDASGMPALEDTN